MERILPVRMDSERKKEMPSVAMSVVIDRSGSMTGLPLEMAKAAAKATVGVLAADDLVEVIVFDSSPTRVVKMQPARNRTRILGDISRVQAGGGTEIFPALDAAYQDMTVTQARKKHVILLTDGRAPVGGLRDLATTMAAESITVTTVGLGNDVDDQLLKMIADTAGGRYYPVQDPSNLPRIFTKETEEIVRKAAVEEWFQVEAVGDAAFLRSIDVRTAPFLHGYVSTKMKPPPAQELLESRDTQEPILARWRVGLGWTLAWTSDVKSQWASEWLRWPGWERFWGQLVHEHMRQKHRRELDMKTEVVNGQLHAAVDAFGADERFENNLTSQLLVMGPEPVKEQACKSDADCTAAAYSQCDVKQHACQPRPIELRQTAPGRYEATLPLDQLRIVPPPRGAPPRGQGRHPPPGGGELRPRLQPVPARVRQLRARPGLDGEGGTGHRRRGRSAHGGGGVRPRRGEGALPRGAVAPVHLRGDRRLPARSPGAARTALRPQVRAPRGGPTPARAARRSVIAVT